MHRQFAYRVIGVALWLIIACTGREPGPVAPAPNAPGSPPGLLFVWENTDPLPERRIRALSLNASGYVIAGGESGYSYRSKKNGEEWKRIPLAERPITAFALAPNDYLYAGTDGEGVFISRDNALSWAPTALQGKRVQALLARRDGSLWAATGDGVFVSPDEGNSWVPLNAGLSHPGGVQVLGEGRGGSLWAGTIKGMYRLGPGETSWEAAGLESLACLDMALAHDSSLWVATENGVFRSLTGGDPWERIVGRLPYRRIAGLAAGPPPWMFAATSGGVFYLADVDRGWRAAGPEDTSIQILLYHPKDRFLYAVSGKVLYRMNIHSP
ncbi:MAG: hypothetical protein D6681_17060 [Calditrichaeota bacterium]|nr:MAG: hypothetical protein D6681_17060 [Calditrichota bacterium]